MNADLKFAWRTRTVLYVAALSTMPLFFFSACHQAGGALIAGIDPAGEATSNHIFFTFYSNDSLAKLHFAKQPPSLPNHYSFTYFSNDSLGNFLQSILYQDIPIIPIFAEAFDPHEEFDWASLTECPHLLADSNLYAERWDSLPQAKFWKMIMNMGSDSCLTSLAGSRLVVDRMPTKTWLSWSDSIQMVYKDSIKELYQLDTLTPIYITSGKNYYYDIEHVLPSISRAIEIFEDNETDPWYAQAILLIESPGRLQFSPVGAYGSFQLMKEVALEHGLVVNDSIDEREDFDKAAAAAAGLIRTRCVPQIKRILRNNQLQYEETDTWFKLLVLHAYHAGAGNVEGVINLIDPEKGGIDLMTKVWRTEYGGFKNASQNYSQVALASLLRLNQQIATDLDSLCNQITLARAEEAPETEALLMP